MMTIAVCDGNGSGGGDGMTNDDICNNGDGVTNDNDDDDWDVVTDDNVDDDDGNGATGDNDDKDDNGDGATGDDKDNNCNGATDDDVKDDDGNGATSNEDDNNDDGNGATNYDVNDKMTVVDNNMLSLERYGDQELRRRACPEFVADQAMILMLLEVILFFKLNFTSKERFHAGRKTRFALSNRLMKLN